MQPVRFVPPELRARVIVIAVFRGAPRARVARGDVKVWPLRGDECVEGFLCGQRIGVSMS